MRAYIRKQISDILSTLLDGVHYIQTANKGNAKIVLEDCLYVLEAVKHNLKGEVSEKRNLEYEARISEAVDSLDAMWSAKQRYTPFTGLQQQLIEQVTELQKEIENEAEINYEVVFFPYKASMWDSLESVWRAAYDDPACTCYVVPIPYYDRNPDGSIAKMFYEGDQFPNEVPITHYSEYDIAARKPDVAYITNLYDGNNFITTVSPNYYSNELKQHTDLLVYVPYFFTGGDFPESHTTLPAYRNVDKIILQSERMKDYFKDPSIRNKILPLGSPKADRMLHLAANRPVVPLEWAQRINGKKVVMYNTSISSILQHGIKVLKKMLFVFQTFKSHDDVVLLWRPHPLSKSTLQSMRPELYELYLKVEKAFIDEHMGILDTTPDVNTSVALSDAYIGEDSSSVLHLFGITGKPIFTLDIDINQLLTEEEKLSVHFVDGYLEDNHLWFVDGVYQAVCKLSLINGEIEIVKQISGESKSFFQYGDIQKVENKIVMAPLHSQEICEYDLQTKEFTKRTIHSALSNKNFDRMIRYKDYLFLKPKAYEAIVRYDIKSGEMKYFYDCLKPFTALKKAENEDMFFWGVCIRDNLMLIASGMTNQVLEFNMETSESQIYCVGPEGMNYFDMTYDGKNYWLVPNEGKSIIRWNYETGEFIQFTDFPAGFEGETKLFVNIICCGNFLLAFPREGNMIVKIDVATGGMSPINWQLPYKEGDRKTAAYNYSSQYYFAKKIDSNRVVSLSAYDNSLLVYNIDKDECTALECRLNQQGAAYLTRQLIKNSFGKNIENLPYNCEENNLYRNIDAFIEYLQLDEMHDYEAQKSAYSGILNNMDGTCGNKIHHVILQQLSEGRKAE